jgi:hypothetical protein
MVDFHALDRETQTFALVGNFMDVWSSLDSAIDAAIAGALRLNKIQEYILGRNVSFTNKINILGALCSVSQLMPEYKKYYADMLKDIINNFYWRRNIIAHDMFRASKISDGVEFLTMRARGNVRFPDIDWSVEEFSQLFIKITSISLHMHDLANILKGEKPPFSTAVFTSLATLLSERLPPNSNNILQAFQDLQFLQPLTDHMSETTPATPQTDGETSPSVSNQ